MADTVRRAAEAKERFRHCAPGILSAGTTFRLVSSHADAVRDCLCTCRAEPPLLSACAGIQVTTQFKQTMTFFKPLYRDLSKRRVPGDMLAGLWMIVDAIRNRNYLYAYDIYMRLAIGARCWLWLLFCPLSGPAALPVCIPALCMLRLQLTRYGTVCL